jgi:hypothetical protein
MASSRIPSRSATRWNVIVPPSIACLNALFLHTSVEHCRRHQKPAYNVKRESVRDLATLICEMSGDAECWRRAGRAGVTEVDDAIARVHLLKQSPGWLANATADGRAGMSPLSNS